MRPNKIFELILYLIYLKKYMVLYTRSNKIFELMLYFKHLKKHMTFK